MEYEINHTLCKEESRLFAECAKASGLRVVIDCKPQFQKFTECSNRWFNDEEFRQRITNEYLAKRKKFRETGVAEKSPFKRL